ncbi:hypothetical protein OUZ56_027286 [Daphnia magna]|uniref:Uncharacterized protein n=1 Tax=Daphnia magna TaxID=35525 RepID=A0ABQ9ZPC9_9CRUS|nr:hypothetical protein OUZ56_027286 [Daphnia magna]
MYILLGGRGLEDRVLPRGTFHRTRELYINLGNWACAAALVRACRGKTKGDLSTCPAWLDLLDHQPVVAGIATSPMGSRQQFPEPRPDELILLERIGEGLN